jgi:hypothetical protein
MISLKSTGLSFAAQPPERAWLVSLAAVASFIDRLHVATKAAS